jgi:pyruvate dehydrogenase E1 component
MYVENEDIFYYLALYNENHAMPPMPEGVEDGILKGLYKFKPGCRRQKSQGAHFRQRPIMQSALKAQEILAENTASAPMSGARPATSCCAPMPSAASAGTCCIPPNRRRKSYVENLAGERAGAFVAVSDNIRTVPTRLRRGCRADCSRWARTALAAATPARGLRRFFGVDVESTVIGTLYALAEKNLIGHAKSWRRPSKIWALILKRSSRRLFETASAAEYSSSSSS